jgi:hypothetical protein
MAFELYRRQRRRRAAAKQPAVEGNLRGLPVRFKYMPTKTRCRGVVITRTRYNRWLIESPDLPSEYERGGYGRRVVLDRSQFDIVDTQ